MGAGGKVILATKESGGIAHVNNHRDSWAELGVKEHGGEDIVSDTHDVPNASLGVSEHGGRMQVEGKGVGAAVFVGWVERIW